MVMFMRHQSLMAFSVAVTSAFLCDNLAFVALRQQVPRYGFSQQTALFVGSTVRDEDGPTPPPEKLEIKTIDPKDLGYEYNRSDHPVEGQPWRRGMTDGCEDPLDATWRLEAEALIRGAVRGVGARVEGVTWGIGQLIVTLGNDLSGVDTDTTLVLEGPQIIVDRGEDFDSLDYGWKSPYSDEEFKQRLETHPYTQLVVLDPREKPIDTEALSLIAMAIQDTFTGEVEERLQILSRHELLLTMIRPEEPTLLQTQEDFDKWRGHSVSVETRDPFKSNRTLKGVLMSRNALDVTLNIQNRLVTVPHNFVYRVTLDIEDDDEEEVDSEDVGANEYEVRYEDE